VWGEQSCGWGVAADEQHVPVRFRDLFTLSKSDTRGGGMPVFVPKDWMKEVYGAIQHEDAARGWVQED